MDNKTTTESTHATTTTPTTTSPFNNNNIHSKSKSEPVELTLQDYERLAANRFGLELGRTDKPEEVAVYDRCSSSQGDYIEAVSVSPLQSSNNCLNEDFPRVASPTNYKDSVRESDLRFDNTTDRSSPLLVPESPSSPNAYQHTSSRSEILYSNTHVVLDEQMASYSSEDLRHCGKDVADVAAKGQLNTSMETTTRKDEKSANDLREATERYYKHVAKSNPRLRNTIPGKDTTNNAMKFTSSRKSSSPCHGEPSEELSRGGTRATIATSSSVATRMAPRSKTPEHGTSPQRYSPVSPQPPQPQQQPRQVDLQDLLSQPCDNSMMSRLLRSENISGAFQTNNNLMQIPEIPNNNNNNNNNGAGGCRSDAGLVRSRNRSDCSESTSATSDVLSRHRQEGYGKATNTVSSRSCTSINTTTSCETEVER